MAKKKPAKKKPAKRPTRKPARRATSTALVRRPPDVLEAQVLPERVVPAEGLLLGELGLVDLKLADKEESVLAEPVPEAEIQVKPEGRGVLYLSHPTYTKWFNRAFGRLGWSIVQIGKPQIQDKSLVVPYVLFIHGRPVKAAYGEQEYFPQNRDQTFGDALEATQASALRRLAKRMGVGLELWDRAWMARFLRDHCVKVRVKARKKDRETGKWEEKDVYQWRRRDADPFEGETSERRPPARREAQETHNAAGDRPITEEQARRLGRIITSSDRTVAEVKAWFKLRFGVESVTALPRQDYDYAIRCIQAPGSLPVREPGDD